MNFENTLNKKLVTKDILYDSIYMKKTGKFIETKNRLVVAQGWEVGEGGGVK